MDKIRWGIIGCGRISRRMMGGMQNASEGMAQAIYSRDISRAKAFAEEFGIPSYYDDLDALIASGEIDAAYIAANHPWHEELAIRLMEGGLPVLCEKPIAVNAEQLKRMAECARKNDVLLMEAIWTRYFPAYAQAREWLDEGRIGKVYAIDCQLGFKFDITDKVERVFRFEQAGSTLLDLGVYTLNIAGMIADSKPAVISSAPLIGLETGTDITDSIVLRYENGIVATMLISFEMDLSNDLVILGENGRIVVPLMSQPKGIRLESGSSRTEISYDFPGEGFQFEVDAVSRYIKQGVKDSPVMPIAESLSIARIMDGLRSEWGLHYPCE